MERDENEFMKDKKKVGSNKKEYQKLIKQK